VSDIQVCFEVQESDIQEILIAYLNDLGYVSFQQTDEALLAFIPTTKFDEKEVAELLQSNIFQNHKITYSIKEIAEQNWNKLWESNYDAVIIEDALLVKAAHHNIEKKYKYVIELSPKMSFGTGHHETTNMMLAEMMDLSFEEKAVLDFGSGTAILSIFASMLQAKNITAIDYEEWAYKNAIENCQINNVTNVTVLKGSAELFEGQQFNVILANINKNIILQYMNSLYNALKLGGELLISGILLDDREAITIAAKKYFKTSPIVKTRGNWSMIRFRKV